MAHGHLFPLTRMPSQSHSLGMAGSGDGYPGGNGHVHRDRDPVRSGAGAHARVPHGPQRRARPPAAVLHQYVSARVVDAVSTPSRTRLALAAARAHRPCEPSRVAADATAAAVFVSGAGKPTGATIQWPSPLGDACAFWVLELCRVCPPGPNTGAPSRGHVRARERPVCASVGVPTVVLRPDAIVTVLQDNVVYFWNPRTGSLIQSLPCPTAWRRTWLRRSFYPARPCTCLTLCAGWKAGLVLVWRHQRCADPKLAACCCAALRKRKPWKA